MGRKRGRWRSMEKISELPVHIIHIILSLLPPRSRAVASTVSKSWWRAHVSFPELYICERAITRSIRKSLPMKADSDCLNCVRHLGGKAFRGCPVCIIIAGEKLCAQVMIGFVNEAFHRFEKTGLNLQKFTLNMSNSNFGEHVVSTVERWINSATAAYNLYELRIFFVSSKKKPLPVMPSTLLANGKSLRVLTLTYCKFEDNFLGDYSTTTILHSLQKLTLSNVEISDSVLARLISCCPLVLELSLNDCASIRTLCVDSLSKLKKVHLQNIFRSNEFGFEKIVIESPELECFCLEQFSCKKECEIDLRSSRTSLEVLEISCWVLPKSILREVQVSFSSFTCLKILSLHYCHPLLERIDLSRLKSLRDASIFAPQSLKFDDPSIGVLLGSFKSPNRKQTTFTVANISMTCWIKKIRSLLWVLQNEKSVSLHIPVKDLGKFQHEEFHVNPKIKKCRVQHLKLKFEADCNCKDIVNALFNMGCISVLTLTWCRTSLELDEKIIQLGLPKRKPDSRLDYEKLTCCSGWKDACWRRYIYDYEEIKGDSLGDVKLRILMEWPEYREKRKYIEESMILAGPKICGQCNVYDCFGLPCLN